MVLGRRWQVSKLGHLPDQGQENPNLERNHTHAITAKAAAQYYMDTCFEIDGRGIRPTLSSWSPRLWIEGEAGIGGTS